MSSIITAFITRYVSPEILLVEVEANQVVSCRKDTPQITEYSPLV